MSNVAEVEPKVIGSPDCIREQSIKDIYDVICTFATDLVKDLELFLDQKDKLDLKILWNLLKAKDAKYYLYQTFVTVKKLTFPGMDLEKVLASGLVAVPTEIFDRLVADRAYFLTEIDNLTRQIDFFFPLEKLWHEDRRVFSVTDDYAEIEAKEFDECVYKSTRVFTSTDFENEAMKKLDEFVESWNNLFEIGFFPVHIMKWKNGAFENFTQAVAFDAKTNRPLSIRKDLGRKAFYVNLLGRKMPTLSFYKREELF